MRWRCPPKTRAVAGMYPGQARLCQQPARATLFFLIFPPVNHKRLADDVATLMPDSERRKGLER